MYHGESLDTSGKTSVCTNCVSYPLSSLATQESTGKQKAGYPEPHTLEDMALIPGDLVSSLRNYLDKDESDHLMQLITGSAVALGSSPSSRSFYRT